MLKFDRDTCDVWILKPTKAPLRITLHWKRRENGCYCRLSTSPFSPVQPLLNPPVPLLLPPNPSSTTTANFPAISSLVVPVLRRRSSSPSPQVLLHHNLRSSPLRRRSRREDETGNCRKLEAGKRQQQSWGVQEEAEGCGYQRRARRRAGAVGPEFGGYGLGSDSSSPKQRYIHWGNSINI